MGRERKNKSEKSPEKDRQDKKRLEYPVINFLFLLVQGMVIFPLLMIAGYNVPTADDWSYGRGAYQAICAGRYFWFPVVAASLALQILYTPSPLDSFFWYTGSVNYTFVFGLSLVLVSLFVLLAMKKVKGWRAFCLSVAAGLLAVMVGGNNYSTSLSSVLCMLAFYVWMFLSGKCEKLSSLAGGEFLLLGGMGMSEPKGKEYPKKSCRKCRKERSNSHLLRDYRSAPYRKHIFYRSERDICL